MDRLVVERTCQISESHCGPATLQMMLARLGVIVTQEEVAEAAGVCDTIDVSGIRIDQLALAVRRLAPQLRFWWKSPASPDDLSSLVMEHRTPAGVEWQGIFEDGDDDPGHYSLVTFVDEERQEIWIADPYRDYFEQDRALPLAVFIDRWWDTNEVYNTRTHAPELVEDYHMVFVVTPGNEQFPRDLGMNTVD